MDRSRSDYLPIQIAAKMPAHPTASNESLTDVISYRDLQDTSDLTNWVGISSSNSADDRNETATPLLVDQQYLEDLSRRREALRRSLLPPPPPLARLAVDNLHNRRSLFDRLSAVFRPEWARRLPTPFFPHAIDDRPAFEVTWRDFNESISRRALVRSCREQILSLRNDDASKMLDALQTV
jgi:hypothetical protein